MQGSHVRRQLPYSLLATAVVVVAPGLIVAAMGGWGFDPGLVVGIAVCVALSLLFARGAAALWRRSPRSREVLFADLMLWGWVRRVATERRLLQARNLVQDAGGGADQRVRALERVSAMLESRDAYTRRHSLRVTRYSEAIARGLDLDEDEVARVRKAAALHDVGKFFTPREVLNKPGRLTDEEFAIIKRHPGQGAALLRGVVEPEVEAMIRHHHERLGGSGYPDGLVGDAIPLGARVIAVADTFDAMTSTRAYRAARPHAKALAVLREEAGVALDARAVAAFCDHYSAKRGIAWSSVASGLTQTLAPLRELLLPAARALPALGASAAIAAPVLIGGGDAAVAAKRPARDGGARAIRTAPAATPAPLTDRIAVRGRGGDGVPARRRAPVRAQGEVRENGPTSAPLPSGDRGDGGAPGRPGAGRPKPAVTPGTLAAPGDPGSPAAAPEGAAPSTPTDGGPPATPAPASTAAPTTAPEVATGEVVVGPVTVPPVGVDLPDLPVALPQVTLPQLQLP